MVITTKNAGEDVVKQEYLYNASGNVNYYNHYGNKYEEKTRARTAMWSSDTSPGHLPKRT
jgi:hypothetical protein